MSTSKHITPQEDSIFIDFASFQIQFLEELLWIWSIQAISIFCESSNEIKMFVGNFVNLQE